MYFGTKDVANEVMILANDDFVCANVTLKEAAEVGTPVAKDGTVVSSGKAYGIVLHNTTAEEPVTAVIIRGFLSEAALTKLGKNISAYKALLPDMVKVL